VDVQNKEPQSKLQSQSKPTPQRTSRDVLIRDGDYVQLTDLDTAGYLYQNKMHLQSAVRVSRYKFEFTFYDPACTAEQLAMDFVNSCCADFADAICRLKKVIHRFHGRDPTEKNRGSNGRPGYHGG